jgi:DNA polymerase-3 subunit alpha
VYLHAACFVDLPRSAARQAFEIIGRHQGGSPLFLVSSDGELEERLGGVEDSSDLHAELKQLLGPKCIGYLGPQSAEPEMDQVS